VISLLSSDSTKKQEPPPPYIPTLDDDIVALAAYARDADVNYEIVIEIGRRRQCAGQRPTPPRVVLRCRPAASSAIIASS
jgi:hypothetical protein